MKAVLLTGCNGGIGSAISTYFFERGFYVIGVDIHPNSRASVCSYLQLDLGELVDSDMTRREFLNRVISIIDANQLSLVSIVNNAAVQILGGVSDLLLSDFLLSQKVNVAAPLLLVKLLFSRLSTGGSVINVGSIHSNLTKPGFVSYATSKAAMRGLTQAMAVDLNGRVRVNCIEPAAILTSMLVEGFEENPEGLNVLKSYHPSNEIGTPEEVAELCYFLVSSKVSFLNGSCISVDGAISSRLHDPG